MGIKATKTKTINLDGSQNNLLKLMLNLEESSSAKEIVANYPNLNDFQRDLAVKSICLGFNCLSKKNAKLILKTVYMKDTSYSPAKELFEQFFDLGKSLKNMDSLNSIAKSPFMEAAKYLLEINDREYSIGQKLELSKIKEFEEKTDEELLQIIGVNNEANISHK